MIIKFSRIICNAWKHKQVFITLVLAIIFVICLYLIFTLPDEKLLNRFRITIQFIAVCLGAGGLYIAFLNYRRKSGVKVECLYKIPNEHKFPDFICLKNKKDRDLYIQSVYLPINPKTYLKIRSKPIVLKAYEFRYIPIDKEADYSYLTYEYVEKKNYRSAGAPSINIDEVMQSFNKKDDIPLILLTDSGSHPANVLDIDEFALDADYIIEIQKFKNRRAAYDDYLVHKATEIEDDQDTHQDPNPYSSREKIDFYDQYPEH